MLQSSYLQTIARREKSPLPVLMPPRSPLSRIEVPLTAEVADESIPVQPPSEPANRVVVSPQQQPSTQMKQVRSPVDSATTAPARLPSSIELAQEIQATSVLSKTSSVSPAVQNSQQKTSTQSVQPTTPVTHSIPAPEELAQLPNRSGQSSNFAPVTTPKPRSYLAKAATSLILKTSPKVSKAASPEIASPEVSESVVIPSKVSKAASPEVSESVVIHSKVSKVASPETASPEVSESVVILQAPQNDSARQKFDRAPRSSTATDRGNTVHIGTIDIHIAPPPTPPIQPVATAPKPVALSPLARGFTSSFGLRQG